MQANNLVRRAVMAGAVLATAMIGSGPVRAEPAAHRGFVEGGLALGYNMSNQNFLEDGNGATYASPRAAGVALDLAGGYAVIPNLYLFGDLQWAHASSIDAVDQDGDRDHYSYSYTSLAVGIRTAVPAGPGEVYAQMGLGLLLPFESKRDQHFASGNSRFTTTGYNTGLGARAEAGYRYDLTDRLFLGAGVRVQAFSTDNVGKQRTRTDQPSGNVEIRYYSTDPNAPNSDRPSALSLQDVRLRLSFGVRF